MEKVQTVHINTYHDFNELHIDNFYCYYDSISSFHDWNDKIILGDGFKCRFCGETNRNQFKRGNAHTFPHSTGNRWLFSKDECKKCNELFSIYENELANHGALTRTLYGIKKKGKPTPKFKNNALTLQRNEAGIKMLLDIENKDKIKEEKDGKVTFKSDFRKNEHIVDVVLPEKEYKPLYLLKSLAKIAFSIMPNKELNNGGFDYFRNWLLNETHSYEDERYLPYFLIYHNRLHFAQRDPMLFLFKKHSDYSNNNMPTYSFLFCYGNHISQIYLPYCEPDKRLLEEESIKLLICPQVLTEKDGKNSCTIINGSETRRTKHKDLTFKVRR